MRYIKLEAAYKFKIDGYTYKQTHYRGVVPEECFQTVRSQLLYLFSNVFGEVVFLESIRATEVSQLEYESGTNEELVEISFLQQLTEERVG